MIHNDTPLHLAVESALCRDKESDDR